MSLYFFKPVVWNSSGYRKPSGARFTSGYPIEHGYGHEEWNNSDTLFFTDGKKGKVIVIAHPPRLGALRARA
jgi:hypothetical protein